MKDKNLGRCPDKKCPYEHSIKKWETLTGKKAKVKAKTQGAQDAQPQGNSGGQSGGWDKPVGLGAGGQLAMLAGGQAAPRVHAVASTTDNKENDLTRLNELPENIFEKVQNELAGTQFMTKVGIGSRTETIMLDGGSAVNTIPEDVVVSILNENRAAGTQLTDKRHPVKQLEKWRTAEELRGVAGGKTVPLLGAVVLELTLIEVGKPVSAKTPRILVRFKICASGTTDWAPVIIGARAIDCVERGGLGFVPCNRTHFIGAYGIQMERIEQDYEDLSRASVYCIRHSVLDEQSDEDFEVGYAAGLLQDGPAGEFLHPGSSAAPSMLTDKAPSGTALIFEGEARMVEPDEMLWIPVRMNESPECRAEDVQLALPSDATALEAVPGLWPTGDTEGMICICNLTEIPVALETGAVTAEVVAAACGTTICDNCGKTETLADVISKESQRCPSCNSAILEKPESCDRCGEEHPQAVSYTGCSDCKPERLHREAKEVHGNYWNSQCRKILKTAAISSSNATSTVADTIVHPVYHIVEEPGGIEHLVDCECPTEAYYAALEADMKLRHPKASGSILEHCAALETFLDTSILAGFSFGADKALVAVQKGSLLGHEVSRAGSAPSGERCQAINEFAPLKDQSQVRQFLGCTNWIRWYLPSYYPTAVKLLSEYMKPTAVFPESGLGGTGTLQGDKAVKAIKLMAVHSIETAVFDEAAAIDGSRPLEQVADACGYAWGSTCLQMTADLSRFKVLLMVGKGFTPAQQAWPPLVLEGYAQLMGKRAQRKVLGPMRSVCWTDHANVTKQQVLPSEEIDVKLLRWISEIVADGSEVRSLAGRSAKLGDGTSRNPSDRDELVAQRTKDVKGLIGQVRGFDLDQFLSDWVERGASLPWSIGKHAWVDSEEQEQKTVGALCAAAGVLPKLKVLYVPDYADTTERLAGSSKLACVLQWMLPGREIALAISEGPFEDDDGVGAHFDRQALTESKPKLQLSALKVDCHTSILKLARSAQLHQPEIIFGTGQGAVVAAGYALPELFEKALQTRNVQQTEVGGLASAWGNVKVIIIEGPRLSATGLRAAKLKEAVPELYKETSAV